MNDAQVELRYGVATDVGLVREANEDSMLAQPPVFVVADGMGGHDGGEIASRIVVEEFARLAERGYDPRGGPDAVLATLRSCQRRLNEYGASHRGSDGGPWHGGTTAVVALLVETDDGPAWLLTNLGDSRIYRVAGGELLPGQHRPQRRPGAGRLRAASPRSRRSCIPSGTSSPARSVVRTRSTPTSSSSPLGEAGRILLCSDGVTDLIRDAEIAAVLGDNPDPRDAADRVVAAALAAGGIDNATAVVVDVVGLVDEVGDDSQRQRDSLHEKLGALP